jgi:hypothetical protein
VAGTPQARRRELAPSSPVSERGFFFAKASLPFWAAPRAYASPRRRQRGVPNRLPSLSQAALSSSRMAFSAFLRHSSAFSRYSSARSWSTFLRVALLGAVLAAFADAFLALALMAVPVDPFGGLLVAVVATMSGRGSRREGEHQRQRQSGK